MRRSTWLRIAGYGLLALSEMVAAIFYDAWALVLVALGGAGGMTVGRAQLVEIQERAREIRDRYARRRSDGAAH